MLHLLIVEDDITIREGLRDCINWKDYGIEVVGDMPNGKAALEFILDNPVDIVITDVVMPIMDGIELIKQIRDRELQPEVIFISGYSEIPYFQSAFKLGAVDYLLKPVRLGELDTLIRKAADLCKKQQVQAKTLEEMKLKLAEGMPLLRERFLMDLLLGKAGDEDYISQRLEFLDIPCCTCGSFVVMSIAADIQPEDDSAEYQENKALLELAIKKSVVKSLGVKHCIFCCPLNGSDMPVILCNIEEWGYDDILLAAHGMHEAIHAATGRVVTIGIGKGVSYIGHLNISYRQSQYALEQKCYLGKGQVIHFKDIEKASRNEGYYPVRLQKKIVEAVCLGKEEDTLQLIDALFEDIYKLGRLSRQFIQNICLETVVMVNMQIFEIKNSSSMGEKNKFYWQQLFELETIGDIHRWMKDTLTAISGQIRSIQSSTSRNIVEEMKKLVQDKYHESLSIQSMADEFYLTPNYICLLFKKETGETFSGYLTGVRVNKAKELLRNPVPKLYEIAEKVGYRDAEYFSRMFKRYVGVTPSEYRERLVL